MPQKPAMAVSRVYNIHISPHERRRRGRESHRGRHALAQTPVLVGMVMVAAREHERRAEDDGGEEMSPHGFPTYGTSNSMALI